MEKTESRAVQEPAREVLADLMEAAGRTRAYAAACGARSHEFCFINVEAVKPGPVQGAGICRIPGWDPGK